MSTYAAHKITPSFNVIDFEVNEEDAVTLSEVNQLYVKKGGDVVPGNILFQGTNTYNGASLYNDDIQINDQTLTIYDSNPTLTASINSAGEITCTKLNGITCKYCSWLYGCNFFDSNSDQRKNY
jgi:hypothetical protein